MAAVMRLPASWKDRDLLEDPPFVNVFFIHKHFVHNTRTRGKRDDWLKKLAEEIRVAPDTRAAAARWAEFAFEPDPGETPSKVVAHDHSSAETVFVFVNFYWTWFCNGPLSAQKVLNSERKKRGFWYRLSDIQDNSPSVRAADVTAPLARPVDVSTEVITSELTQESVEAIALGAAVLHDVGDAEEEKDDMVVFADKREVEMFMESSLSPLSDVSSLALPDIPDFGVPDPGEAYFRSPTEVEAASPSGHRLITAIEDTTECAGASRAAAEDMVSRHRTSRRKTGSNSELLSQPPGPTAVANEPSQQTLTDEDTSAKRHSAEDTRGTIQQRNRRKRVKAARTDKSSATFITPTPRARHPLPTSPPYNTLRTSPSNHNPPSTIPVRPPRPKHRRKPHANMSQSGTKGQGRSRKGPRNVEERPSKRQRGEDVVPEVNISHMHQPDNPVHAMQLSVFGHYEGQLTREGSFFAGSPVPNDRETPSGVAASRKRRRDVESRASDAGSSATAADSKEHRVVATMPKPVPSRKALPRCPAPRQCLGIPRDLPEADRMLQDSAANALMTFCNTVPPAEVWPAGESRAEDEHPLSDDEEDVPLRSVISARRQAPNSDSPDTAVEDVVLPDDAVDDFKDPCEWRAASLPVPHPPRTSEHPVSPISSTPTPVLQPKSTSTRIPKKLPPTQFPKRPLTVQPPIWAKSRQEVCESFDLFKSYQGGVYFKDDIARGYLLGGFYASRDLLDREGRLIISHGGGKAESVHNNKGKAKLQEASDQHEGDKSVRALLQTYHRKKEIALLIDDRYALFPYDLSAKKDCTYVVLGFYHIVHAWAERQPYNNAKGFVVRWKFAFEWCERQPAPWWTPSMAEPCELDSGEAERPVAPHEARCLSCKKSSPLVYEEGWMCLQPSCSAFWILPDGKLGPDDLTYDESFLRVSFHCEHDALENIVPRPPMAPDDGVVTSRRFSRGWHCKKCGRLSCRYKWQHWECQNCGETMQVMGKNRIAKEFWGQKEAKFLTHKVFDGRIILSLTGAYRTPDGHFSQYHTYRLPDINGTIYVVLGNPTVNSIADEIFEEYQEQAKTGELQFRRFPLRMHHCRGELLTNYFSQNSGEPYQYVGGSAHTVPFDAAPSAVVKARDLIQSRMMSVMQAESQPYHFNEVLSAAYMEEQSMSFHSDAENGLGPRVASLSLGSCAYMHFRLHKKYRTDGGSGNVPKSLTLFLRHGDVLIMNGADIQEFYEHTVVPLNFRIAATARFIGSNHL